ncbi:hypothetical protein D3C76_01430 [compost metagenome]
MPFDNLNSNTTQKEFIDMLDLIFKDKLEEILCIIALFDYECEFEFVVSISHYYAVFKFTLNDKVLYLYFAISMITKTIKQIRFSHRHRINNGEESKVIISKKDDLTDQIKTIDEFKMYL